MENSDVVMFSEIQITIVSASNQEAHRISDEYFEAINPKRFQLYNATKAFRETSVCAHHKILMETKEDMNKIAEAVFKIKDNIDELLSFVLLSSGVFTFQKKGLSFHI